MKELNTLYSEPQKRQNIKILQGSKTTQTLLTIGKIYQVKEKEQIFRDIWKNELLRISSARNKQTKNCKEGNGMELLVNNYIQNIKAPILPNQRNNLNSLNIDTYYTPHITLQEIKQILKQ